ncbi:Copia protein, partial [Mucuna pruriens]
MTRLLLWNKNSINLQEIINIRTRSIFHKKLDKYGNVVRVQTRLVAQGYNQQDGIDFIEIFALARLEVIRIMLSHLAHKNIKLFQMNVKFYRKEVCVRQPLSFEDITLTNHIDIFTKALIGDHFNFISNNLHMH